MILVGMMHPKHVYMFKNFIDKMEKKGHTVEILSIEKDITELLLKKFQLPFTHIGDNPPSFLGKIAHIPIWTYRTLRFSMCCKPDIFIGQAFPHFAYVSAIQKKPYIIFEDTEISHALQAVTFPFASTIVTPSCFRKDLGKKQQSFEGYFELAYLHPNSFTPDPKILNELGLTPEDPYIIVRFVSWQATHDVGQRGIQDKPGMVHALEKYGRVIITSEGPLPEELENYRIRISPEKLHDLLSFAVLYIGEGGTIATEAAVLGTPSIYISSLVGSLGNFIELETKYHLMESFNNSDDALKRAIAILQDPESKEKWRENRERMLKQTIDFTGFMVRFVENYPQSIIDHVQ